MLQLERHCPAAANRSITHPTAPSAALWIARCACTARVIMGQVCTWERMCATSACRTCMHACIRGWRAYPGGARVQHAHRHVGRCAPRHAVLVR
eukprot:204209-Chlamydomonas_euryale.AAC.1